MLAHRQIAHGNLNASETRALLISESPLSDPLRMYLASSTLRLEHSGGGDEGIAAALRSRPQILLIDGRTNPLQAVGLCARLRSEHEIDSTYLIVITSQAHEAFRAEAFDAGADDCFAEPPSRRELLSRLQALERRIDRGRSPEVISYADVELDLVRHKASRNGALLALSNLQMRLLRYFIEHAGRVFTRQELKEAVWGDKAPDEGAVTVAVVRLRRALNSTGGPELIRQVRGIGYAFEDPTAN